MNEFELVKFLVRDKILRELPMVMFISKPVQIYLGDIETGIGDHIWGQVANYARSPRVWIPPQ